MWRASGRGRLPGVRSAVGVDQGPAYEPRGGPPARAGAADRVVRKRRYACAEVLCERRSFTEISAQLLARARVTTGLKVKVAAAVTTKNRR